MAEFAEGDYEEEDANFKRDRASSFNNNPNLRGKDKVSSNNESSSKRKYVFLLLIINYSLFIMYYLLFIMYYYSQ